MNKEDNKLVISVLTTLIMGITLIYTFIMYHSNIFAIIISTILFLISAYFLTINIISFVTMRTKSSNVQIKNLFDDISSQIETMSSAQAQIGKSTYYYTKQAAKTITGIEGMYAESQEAIFRNLSSISNAQNKATKLMLKYDQNNTQKVIAALRDLRSHLSETMIQGFDQIQPNNSEVVDLLQAIVNYLKTQPNGMDQAMSLQLNNVAHELQNISTSIQRVQMPTASVIQTMPTAQPATATPDFATPFNSAVSANAVNKMPTTPNFTEEISEATENIEIPDLNEEAEMTEIPDLSEEAEMTDIPDLSEVTENIEIPEVPAAQEEEFNPTFTVVENKEPEPDEPVLDDPNKMLSADEIAALFAAAEPTPQKMEVAEEEPAKPEPIQVTPLSDDPNKQLSADEIAALFAAAEPAPMKEDPVEEVAKQEPVQIDPVSDDPNKQLSADEIAALFAQLG